MPYTCHIKTLNFYLSKNERILVMNFANNLKQLRQGRHMTQEALARYLNVTRPTIAGYETKNKQPEMCIRDRS